MAISRNKPVTCPVMPKASHDLRGKVINASRPLTLIITLLHVQRAECGNPAECVIAQALSDHYGEFLASFQVGSHCTKIMAGGKIIRYATPTRLSKSLRLFDKTGKWELPPGQYTLLPYTGGKYRWDKKKKKKDAIGGKQDVFRGHPAVPTRRVKTATQMLAA